MTVWKRKGGFSVLELSIVLSIMTVLSAVSFPYWDSLLSSYRLTTTTGFLTADLRFARFEAVKDNARVRVRFLTTSRYVIERDADGSWVALKPPVDLSDRYWSRGITVAGGSNPPMFYPDGRADEEVTLTVGNDQQDTKRVIVSRSGMIQQE
jgi:prepilin-type N-terminal cleavage/methylation domain-containing protein